MSLTFPATIIQTDCRMLTCLSLSSLWLTVEEISEEIFLSHLTVCLFAAGLAVGLDPEGYGNPDFCWISIYDKLIWSFAGPIAIVILVCVSLSVWCTFVEAVLYTSFNKNIVWTVMWGGMADCWWANHWFQLCYPLKDYTNMKPQEALVCLQGSISAWGKLFLK